MRTRKRPSMQSSESVFLASGWPSSRKKENITEAKQIVLISGQYKNIFKSILLLFGWFLDRRIHDCGSVAQHSTEHIRKMHLNAWVCFVLFISALAYFTSKSFNTVKEQSSIGAWNSYCRWNSLQLAHEFDTMTIKRCKRNSMQKKLIETAEEKTGSEFSVFHLGLFLD